MEKQIFIIKLFNKKFKNGRIIGYIDTNNKDIIAKFIKEKFGLILDKQENNDWFEHEFGCFGYNIINDKNTVIYVIRLNKIE